MKISLNAYVINKPYKVHNLFLQKHYELKGYHLYTQHCDNCEAKSCDGCQAHSIIERCQNEEYWEFERLMSHIHPKCEKCYNLY